MRCTCGEILYDSAAAVQTHRRNRKGACGTGFIPVSATAPPTVAERYDIDKAVETKTRWLKGQADSALKRWARR